MKSAIQVVNRIVVKVIIRNRRIMFHKGILKQIEVNYNNQ